ncbi:chitin synthase-domain-containing protein [Entophlyctis helioformis]|nr:chitin synthase-domain-containing protein [Entophlyctis helioformis]
MDWATQSDDLAGMLAQEAAVSGPGPTSADSIVHTFEQRLRVGRPYAYIGPNVLLSLGAVPPAATPAAETQARALSGQYSQAAEAAVASTDDGPSLLAPHAMQLASTVFFQMLSQQEDQTVVLAGVPGSGKSANRKILSQQLIDLAKNGKKKSKVLSGAAKMESALDAFGHARTVASPHASAFGRYTEYQYASTGRMVGVKLLDYALDRALVTAGLSLPDGDRTFHIFYMLLAGASQDEKESLKLHDANSFVYLKGSRLPRNATLARSGTLSRRIGTLGRTPTVSRKEATTPTAMSAPSEDATPTSEDAERFKELRENLKSLGIGRRMQHQMFQVLAAILHLGNVTFGIDPNLKDDEATVVRNQDALDTVADLLSVSPSSLADSLMYRSKLVGRELCSIFLQPDGAMAQRDALAETLYALVFSWLVEHINTRLCKPEEEVDTFIGVADFPWFNAQHVGPAAQFSVFVGNYAQERLVHYTQNSLFDDVDFILKTDGIQVSVPSYKDNQWSVDVYRGTPRQQGLLTLLDESLDAADAAAAASTSAEVSRPQSVLNYIDNGLKSNPHYIPSFKCSTTTTAGTTHAAAAPLSKNMFGIRHYHATPEVQYDLDSFLDQDTQMSDFVALFRGNMGILDAADDSAKSEDSSTFVASLFSKRMGVRTVRSGRGAILGAQKSQGPLRKPSVKRKKRAPATATTPEEASKDGRDTPSGKPSKVSPFAGAGETVDDLLDTLKATRHWSLFCVSVADLPGAKLSTAHIRWQLEQYSIPELCNFRSARDIDASHGVKYAVFCEKYSSLLATMGLSRSSGNPKDLVKQFVTAQYWPAREIAFGNTMVFLSLSRWRWMAAAMKRLDAGSDTSGTAGAVTAAGDAGARGSMIAVPSQTTLNAAGGMQPWIQTRRESFLTEDDRSDAESNYESEYNYVDNGRPSAAGNVSSDMELGKVGSPKGRATTPKTGGPANKREIVDSVTPVTRARKCWVCCTWSLTWWIPSIFLSCCGKMHRPDIRMAWREKVALCIIIAFMCLSLIFFIVGLRYIICPTVSVKSQDEVNQMSNGFAGRRIPWVSAHGRYYDAASIMDQHKKDYGPGSGTPAVNEYEFESFYGTDVSKLFFKQDRWDAYCPNIQAPQAGWDYLDPEIPWMRRKDVINPLAFHRARGSGGQSQPYIESLNRFVKGRIGWTEQAVRGMSSNNRRYVIIFDNVYYVSPIDTLQGNSFSPTVRSLLTSRQGEDISSQWRSTREQSAANRADLDNSLRCLNNIFYIGTVDRRDTFQCRLTNWLLLSTSIVLVSVIGFKFLAALQFGTRKEPEEGDKFVICMIPCYTEGTESLAKTLDSLATLTYDDKRKLLFVICDGMIIGSGNDRPTPRLVLDILGVDPTLDPEPMAFQSLGEGNKQFNMAKVYSGLYEIRGHSVPFVVVVKVGAPSERVRPGNRGKRDSQLVLMRFLNRVHFNAEFAPLELEIYHHMKDIIGVSPSFYEYVLMVDADTEVDAPSLNRMVAVLVHDVKVMGLCGETRIANEKDSWVTMIQVYEYFISHHLSKAFESLFGTVTCLPGCFSMYRIRTAAKNVPLLVSPSLLADYAENTVDTLHMKNLLHLGEDRYLTTLLLKHFPQMRTKFTAEARCHTVVPDRWNVLLSQRRRWINSTVHNLFELMFLEQLCGFCLFSMRFIVMLDLFATFVQPATVLYIAYLIYAVSTSNEVFPILSIILIAAIYGFQVIIFILKREWQHIAWMIIYMFAVPVFSFWIPCYSFWHFDDFSWGNTRVVVGEGKKTVYVADAEPFNPASIPLKRWKDREDHDQWDRGSQASGTSYQSGVSGKPRGKEHVVTGGHGGYAASEYSAPGGGGYPRGPGSVASGYAPSVAGGGGGGMYGGIAPHASATNMGMVYNNGSGLAPPGMADSRPFSMVSFGGFGSDAALATIAATGPAPTVPGPFPAPVQQQQPQQQYANAAGGPSDEQLLAEIRRVLAAGDLMTLTKKQIRDDLSGRFGVDLKPRKDTINRMIDEVLQGRI